MNRRFIAVVLFLCLGVTSVDAQSRPDTFVGRRLEDVLRLLQTRGLRLVFSSEIVTPDMRIRSEPRAKAVRKQLAETPGAARPCCRERSRRSDSNRAAEATDRRTAFATLQRRRVRRSLTTDRSDGNSVGAVYRERVTRYREPGRSR